MRLVQSAGRNVPADIAVVGFNNIDLTELVDPPLTTVSIPMYEIGQKALEMLRQIRGQDNLFLKPLVFDTKLVIRKSCGCS
jgi:DNA-binding LacI/PurR family transcriptional regulator